MMVRSCSCDAGHSIPFLRSLCPHPSPGQSPGYTINPTDEKWYCPHSTHEAEQQPGLGHPVPQTLSLPVPLLFPSPLCEHFSPC